MLSISPVDTSIIRYDLVRTRRYFCLYCSSLAPRWLDISTDPNTVSYVQWRKWFNSMAFVVLLCHLFFVQIISLSHGVQVHFVGHQFVGNTWHRGLDFPVEDGFSWANASGSNGCCVVSEECTVWIILLYNLLGYFHSTLSSTICLGVVGAVSAVYKSP